MKQPSKAEIRKLKKQTDQVLAWAGPTLKDPLDAMAALILAAATLSAIIGLSEKDFYDAVKASFKDISEHKRRKLQ